MSHRSSSVPKDASRPTGHRVPLRGTAPPKLRWQMVPLFGVLSSQGCTGLEAYLKYNENGGCVSVTREEEVTLPLYVCQEAGVPSSDTAATANVSGE